MKNNKDQKTNFDNNVKNNKQQQKKQLALALKKNLLRRKQLDNKIN